MKTPHDQTAARTQFEATWRKWQDAKDEGARVRRAERESESARLRQEMREHGYRPGTYEHELAVMRGRR